MGHVLSGLGAGRYFCHGCGETFPLLAALTHGLMSLLVA